MRNAIIYGYEYPFQVRPLVSYKYFLGLGRTMMVVQSYEYRY